MRWRLMTCCLAVLVAACLLNGAVPVKAEEAAQSDSQVYTVKNGETIRAIAERFLGSPDNVPELLKYNAIENPLTVKEGTLLAIPGKIRQRALATFASTETKLVEAREAQCQKYATVTYNKAQTTFAEAEKAWNETAYLKAEALCILAAAHARDAIAIAARNALRGLECTITAVHGTTHIKLADDQPWTVLKEGTKVRSGARLRTGANSRIEVTLPDGGISQVGASTELAVSELIEDQRSHRTTTRLRLFMGEILGRIKKRPTEDSTFTVESGESSTAIRGTNLRVALKDDSTRVMVLEGSVAVTSSGTEVPLPADHGLIVQDKHKPGKVVQLLPPPRITLPTARKTRTANQMLTFAWDAVGEKTVVRHDKRRPGIYRLPRSTSYHLELARDPRFNRTVCDVHTREREFRSGVLAPGTYYWRISSLDADLIEGPWSESGEIVIERKLVISASSIRTPVEHKGRSMVPAGTGLKVDSAAGPSSVTSLEISVNGGEFQAYTEDFALDTPGEYTLQVRGIGADGEVGEPETMDLVVDGSAPRIELHVSSPFDDKERGQVVRATVTAEDDTEVARIETSLNDEPFGKYEGPLLLDASRDYTLRTRAIDLVGNASSVRTFKILGME